MANLYTIASLTLSCGDRDVVAAGEGTSAGAVLGRDV